MVFDFAGIAALILALVTLWRTFRSAPKEDKKLDADAAKQFQEIATLVGKRNEELIERVHKNENTIEALEKQVKKLNDLVTKYSCGIDKLIIQLENIGVEPAWRNNSKSKSTSTKS